MRDRLAAQPSGPTGLRRPPPRLDEDVLPYVGHFDHPRFFGYIPGAGTWPAALGDLIAAATNIDAGSWREAVGPSALELTVLDWFRDWIDYPDSAAGVLVCGGSAANLTAIACAREALIGPMSPRIVMYTGDQTHSSVARAARHLGFRPDQLRVLPTDDDFRLRPSDVAAAIDADIAADRLPFLVSANAGTTNTGAVDPIGELADVCHDRGVWLHVDGAYGAFAVLTERGRARHAGPVPGRLRHARPAQVARDALRGRLPDGPRGRLLERAFELHPEYLKEGARRRCQLRRSRPAADASQPRDQGLAGDRDVRPGCVPGSHRPGHGPDARGPGAYRGGSATRDRDAGLAGDPHVPARGAHGESAIDTDRRNEAIVKSLADRRGPLHVDQVLGRYAIRLCVLNHTTEDDDVAFAIDRVAEADVSDLALAAAVPTRPPVAGTTVEIDRLGPSGFGVDDLRRVPGFESITDDQADRFLAVGREERYGEGRWSRNAGRTPGRSTSCSTASSR